eukprot:2797803-Lingulodinium_polyedra.AAC.1
MPEHLYVQQHAGVLILPETKKGIRDSVTITEPIVLRLLQTLLPHAPRGVPPIRLRPPCGEATLQHAAASPGAYAVQLPHVLIAPWWRHVLVPAHPEPRLNL